MQSLLDELRHACSTVDSDVRDALTDADNEDEFADLVAGSMENLMQEAYWWGKSVLDVLRGRGPLPHVMQPLFWIE